MASDFGDESGERLFDWMLRVGQDASEDAIKDAADRLKNAIRNLRGHIEEPERAQETTREYARLNLSEFEELPDYASLKEIIENRLDAEAIEHDIAAIEGHDYLVFRVEDAPAVDSVFKEMEDSVDEAASRARAELERDLSKERDEQPLELKAEAAREASKAHQAAKEAAKELERVEVKVR